MTTWPIVGDGKSIRPSHITTLQDAIDGVQDGTNPIALAGIEGALGQYEPLENMRAGTVNLLDIPGVVGDGVTDCLPALQANYAAAPDGTEFIIPPGDFLLSDTLKTSAHKTLRGLGISSRLIGNDIDGPVILAYSGEAESTEEYQRFRDFSIGGSADCAISFTQCYGVVAERIKLVDFTGIDGFRFEGIWQSHFSDLDTSNADISRACFKVNKVCLDSIWRLCYTGGTSRPDYCLFVDQSASDDGNNTWLGFHELHFDTFTAQQAEVVGIAIVNGSQITLTNPYTESCHIPAQFGKVGTGNWVINVIGGRLLGSRGSETPFDLVCNTLSDLNVYGTRFYDKPIVFGWMPNTVAFLGAAAKPGTKLLSLLERTVDSGANLPLSITGDNRTATTAITLKDSSTGYQMQEMTVDGSGVWSANPVTVPLSKWMAVKSITASGLTATLETYIAHGYSSGNTVVIDCASPKVFNGSYVITVTGTKTFTYTIASTPRESPAIGQPMVMKP